MKKSKRNYLIFLEDILDSAKQIEIYTNNLTKKNFTESVQVQDAVIRRLEVIGEAVKALPASFRKNHPEVQWKEIAGMRDILIHEYFGVNINRLWETVQKDIPDLKKKIKKILYTPQKRMFG